MTPLHELIEWENTAAAAFIDDGGVGGAKKPKPKTLFHKMCDVRLKRRMFTGEFVLAQP